jgi:hypothetical protein
MVIEVYVFVMFKMKYSINTMQCNILSQQVGWLDGRGVCFHPKVKGSNLTIGVCMVNNGKFIKCSFVLFSKISA